MKKTNVYQTVTDRILAAMEQGIVPWRKPFKSSFSPIPVNFSTGKPYRGINVFLLNLSAWQLGYPKNAWLTFKQAKTLGGHVRKGETSETVLFWKSYHVTDSDEAEEDAAVKTIFVARAYNVFNIQQCEGIDPEAEQIIEVPQLGSAPDVYANYPAIKPEVLAGTKAVYIPSRDQVRIPSIKDFTSQAGYYATLFHELIHSTGHESRLNREGIAKANRSDEILYAQEELVAEMGAAFLCALTGIETPELTTNATAYLQSWLEVFKQDKTMIVKAASRAQRSVDYIVKST
jgi:antirestriction protein ArdC